MKAMKWICTILVVILMAASVWAQVPEKMSYQAVVRDAGNELVTNTGIGMQISILKGSVTGEAVYIERQFPTTNANGLVTIEIGGGIVVGGDFSAIDWASDTYFVKTEIDLNGGANYTITGTSQLLSVPYALHAKTAESITGEISESDPVYMASQAANITATDIANLDNLSGVNTGDQTISRTGLTVTLTNGGSYQDSINVYSAGDGIDIVDNVVSEHKYQIGDFAHGGVVFWVDETGEHGLVCAKEDQDDGSGIRWYAGTYGATRAYGDGPYAGEANTTIIIAAHVAIGDDGNTYAARICNELQITEGGKTYGDWYLPSKEELYLMYQNKAIIDATAVAHGGTALVASYYWSSTEASFYYEAREIDFSDGYVDSASKYAKLHVRAIRAF